mgnify:FL=1|tara:strand:- start:1630 stop:2652 length:1023 start_codon:yes stop_codon:yes gene_type:complete
MIDLRSDTITKPTVKMLEVMLNAKVGDDVFGEDPTVNELQARVAHMFGKEAGLFVPSGTMSNQLGVKVLTQPGDEILIEKKGHIYNYESSGASMLSGVQIAPIEGIKGKLTPSDLANTVRGLYDWEPKTTVLCLENTTNKGGGACYTELELKKLRTFADTHNLKIHLDGARIWNAITATGIKPKFFGEIADTISVCFSKGLGAPVGSMLLSSKKNIGRARRYRKMWGGGMRQIGLLAEAANYAIDHHQSLLVEDHRRAKELALVINECEQLTIDLESIETNILIFEVLTERAVDAVEKLGKHGVRMVPFGPNTVRATFHFEIGDEQLEMVKAVIKQLYSR